MLWVRRAEVKRSVQFNSVQDGSYGLGKPHTRSTLSQKFPERRLRNGSNVRLIDDGSLSPFQGRLTSSSSFHASLLQAIDGVMSLALCPQVVSQAPDLNTADFPRSKPLVRVVFPASLSAWSFPFTPAFPRACVVRLLPLAQGKN